MKENAQLSLPSIQAKAHAKADNGQCIGHHYSFTTAPPGVQTDETENYRDGSAWPGRAGSVTTPRSVTAFLFPCSHHSGDHGSPAKPQPQQSTGPEHTDTGGTLRTTIRLMDLVGLRRCMMQRRLPQSDVPLERLNRSACQDLPMRISPQRRLTCGSLKMILKALATIYRLTLIPRPTTIDVGHETAMYHMGEGLGNYEIVYK